MNTPPSRPGALIRVALAALLLTTAPIPVGFAASLTMSPGSLAAIRTCTLTATPSTTTAVADASVRQASASSNFGTVTTNNIASANGANRRLYVRFDLAQCTPAIAASATVTTATLRLFVTALPAACRTNLIFRVTSSWTETGITWTNQPFGTAINNPASGTATDAFDVGTPAGCQNRTANAYTVGADVKADVAAFLAGSATNLGWMLRDSVEGSATTYTQTASAKELATVAQAPQLVVTYSVVP